jgi:hypothetical protein
VKRWHVKQTDDHKVEIRIDGQTFVLRRFAARDLASAIEAASFIELGEGPAMNGDDVIKED